MPIFRSVVQIDSPDVVGTGVNTFHFRTTSADPTNNGLLLQIASNALAQMYNNIKNNATTDTVFRHDGTWQEIASLEPTQVQVNPWAEATSLGGDPLPLASAMLIRWSTALSARSGRGRTFFSPCKTTTLQSNGTPSEEARASLLLGAGSLVGDFGEPGDGAFGVWSPTDGVLRDFTGVSVANNFAVLRSRRD